MKIALLLCMLLTWQISPAKANWNYPIPPLNQSELFFNQITPTTLPQEFQILVWNTLKGERVDWKKDFINLSENRDLLLLQEGYLDQKMRQTFLDLKDYQFYFGISFLYGNLNNLPTGTVLASKMLPTHQGILRTKDVEPFIKTPKTVTYATFQAETGQEVLVINIHGINFANHDCFVRHIQLVTKVIDRHQGPVIFAGDFNTRTPTRMKYLIQEMASRGLSQVQFQNDRRLTILGNPLDHVFIRGMTVKNAQVRMDIDSSDHKPLLLTLKL